MNATTKTIVATLVGAIFNFLGGWVVFGMLLEGFYKSNTQTYEGLSKGEMPDLAFIFLSGVFSAYLVTFILKRVTQEYSFGVGFKYGFVAYFCMAAAFNLSMYAFYNLMSMTGSMVDIIAQGVFGGINGGIIALVLGMGKKSS